MSALCTYDLEFLESRMVTMASKKVKISANQALNATNKVLNSMTEISDHYVNGKNIIIQIRRKRI